MIKPQIKAVVDRLEELGKSRLDACQISRSQGEMLRQIALSTKCRVVVEIGTSYGYSGLFLAAALQRTGGMLHTIDSDPAKVEAAKAAFTEAGVIDHVIQHQGDAAAILATLKGPFDLVFVDADKPSTQTYYDLVWPKLTAGGSVVVDNVTSHVGELRGFVEHVRAMPDTVSAEIDLGNGFEWTIKHKNG